MLGKIKTLFKMLFLSMAIVVLLFAVHRREYLSQAIPVYMQYLEQRGKWEKNNTGTYAYYSSLLNTYYFIQNNTLSKIMRYGNYYGLKSVKDFKDSIFYKKSLTHKDIDCYFKYEEYLIEKRFDAIWRLIWIERPTNRFASFTKCDFRFSFTNLIRSNNDAAYEIGYNKQYAYPMAVYDKSKKYLLSEPSHIHHLIIFPKGTQYTDEVLKKTLDYFRKQDIARDDENQSTIKVSHIVGGNMIKSGLFDINSTFQINDE